jgi:spoIIIJ-associated protein
MTEDVAIEEQGDIVAGFLEGLLEAFGAEGEVVQEVVDESTVELKVQGDDLGLLIGPRGATLTAVHEMCRTVLQREVAGGARARIRVDIGGYRERRRAALAGFARTQAEGVLEDRSQRALEPMGAADRKVIHDTVNDMDGVRTISEGEDPKRRVVIIPGND